MPTITLAAKIRSDHQLQQLDKHLKSFLEDLKVQTHICPVSSSKWVRIDVSGDDQNIVLNYLADTIGISPPNLQSIQRFSTIKGYITALNEKYGNINLDVGLSYPNNVSAVIPVERLSAQLGDGRQLRLKEFAKLFGFCKDLPLLVRVVSIDEENKCIEAELSEKQRRQYMAWTMSLLDRLLVLGASYEEVESAIKINKLERDVLGSERMGIFEHAVVCKLGTDAAGLIPKIGRNLRNAVFSVFSPRRILKFFGEDSVSSVFG